MFAITVSFLFFPFQKSEGNAEEKKEGRRRKRERRKGGEGAEAGRKLCVLTEHLFGYVSFFLIFNLPCINIHISLNLW